MRALLLEGQFLIRLFDFFSQTASFCFQLTIKAGISGKLIDLLNRLIRSFFRFPQNPLGFLGGVSDELFFSLVQPLFFLGKPGF